MYINDLGNVWQFLMLLLWFGTPIFYSVEQDQLLASVNAYNPLFHFIELARQIVVYGQAPELLSLLTVTMATLVSLLVGYGLFKRLKVRFAELV